MRRLASLVLVVGVLSACAPLRLLHLAPARVFLEGQSIRPAVAVLWMMLPAQPQADLPRDETGIIDKLILLQTSAYSTQTVADQRCQSLITIENQVLAN